MSQLSHLLQVSKLCKEFGGVAALHNVSFEVMRGEVFAIIGPNGAGKTTLFNLISGALPATAGDVYFKGRRLNHLSPDQIAAQGIARTFQTVQTFSQLSVLENVMVGRHLKLNYSLWHAALRLPRARAAEQRLRADALTYLEMVGLSERANDPAAALPFGQQRILEVARALAVEPELLLLDEPGAGLTQSEVAELDRLIQRLRARGMTILLVEHNMELVMGIADRVIVLDYGRKIAEGTPLQVQHNAQVIAAYLGEEKFTVV